MTTLKEILKMGGLDTSESDLFQGIFKRRWDLKEDPVSTQGKVLSEEISIAKLLGHCHISAGKIYNSSFEIDGRFTRSAIRDVLLNESLSSLCVTKRQKRACIYVLPHSKELRR